MSPRKKIGRTGMSVAVCAIAKHEGAYVDEWIAYHLALGFVVHVYDNSDDNELAARASDVVKITHFPGPCKQLEAYAHFVASNPSVTWAAFLDVDEFLNLKTHRNVHEFLAGRADSVCINWAVFGSSGHEYQKPGGVLERFTRRAAAPDPHVKTIAFLPHVAGWKDPHVPLLKPGAVARDTRGTVVAGPLNPGGPADVAVVNHYFTKSREEFAAKVARGRADVAVHRCPSDFELHDLNDVEDTRARDFFRAVCHGEQARSEI